ncbi:HNH endonuclease signature motif containing protein [Paenibacillus sp. BAC0078]
MQTQVKVSKEKEQTSVHHKPYSYEPTYTKPAAARQPDPVEIIRRIRKNPASLTREDQMALRRILGNRAAVQLLSELNKNGKKEEKKDEAGGKQEGKGSEGQAKASEGQEVQGGEAAQAAQSEPEQPAQAEEAPVVKVEQRASEPQPQSQGMAQAAVKQSGAIEQQPNQKVKTSDRIKGFLKKNLLESSVIGKTSPGSVGGAGPLNGEGKAAAQQKEESRAASSAEGSGKESEAESAESQLADGKVGEDAKEGKGEGDKGSEGVKSEKGAQKGKAPKGGKGANDTPEKAASKEPSLGAALGAIAGDGKETPAKGKKVNIRGEDPGQILDQLNHVQPTQMGDAYAQAVDVSAGAFAKQKQKAKQSLPVIPAPTGLKGKVLKARRKPVPLKLAAPEGYKSEKSGGAAPGNLERMNIGSSGSEGNPEAIMSEIRSAAAQPPGISMTGEADPSQVEGFGREASQQVGAAKQAEMGQINNPFGENDIFPEPDGSTLKAGAELQGGNTPAAKKLPGLAIPGEMTAGLNKSLAPEMNKQFGVKQAEYSKEKEKFDSKVTLSKADSQSQIQKAEAEAKEQQLSQQAGAKAEVNALRGEWKNELDAAEADYAGQAGVAAQQKKSEINTVRTEKEREAQKRQSEAEQEATTAYSKAKKETDGKHEEEKAKEEKKGGFLGWVKDKLEAVVEVVKKAVNFIFEGLRKAVKFIFEKAKQAVLGIIELGRRLITDLIKGLGTLLKKLVSVVFAKFPGIAAKICGKIDAVVNKAVKVVNQLAQKLKTKVTQVMDFLATKVDQALAVVQNFYTKLISTLGNLLITVFLDVMERIGALGKAAKRSFSHLEGKMWEYLLGVDISKPLGASAAEGGAEQTQEAGEPQPEEKLTADDIEMESVEVGEMDPELVQDINLKDGETKQLPGSSDPHTMDSIMADFDTGKADQSLGGKIADGVSLRANNAKMVFDQIKTYVIKWMKSNGLKLLAAVIGLLVGVVVAEIVTGGAITAALPAIIQLVSLYLQADAIKSVAQTLAQASGYIGTYLSQGWQKMIEPAAIALATAMAMGLVELAMELGFKGLGKGLKKAGQAVKKGAAATARGVKKVAGVGAKGIKSLLKTGAKLASKSGNMIIQSGKIVIKSLQKGLMKGTKKLKGLLDRILTKFKFKKFKLERKGKHIRLYGEVNPWVLLADGTIEEVDEQKLKQLELDGKKPITLSNAELEKLNKLDKDQRAKISKGADGDKSRIDFDSIKEPGVAGNDFVGTLKGEQVTLSGVKTKEIVYTKRLPEDTAQLRREFDSTVRKKFLKEFANDSVKIEKLGKAGLSESDIARMRDGFVPKGWQVHHKLPLDAGGTNSLDNLILIKNDPYHKVITNAQNELTRGLEAGQSKKINWPIPEGDIYPPGE